MYCSVGCGKSDFLPETKGAIALIIPPLAGDTGGKEESVEGVCQSATYRGNERFARGDGRSQK